jgi:hypothetical protein
VGGLDLTIPIYSIFDNPPVADMSILLGNGDGTFRAGPAFPLTDQNVNNAAVADFWGRPFTPPPAIQWITTGPQVQPPAIRALAFFRRLEHLFTLERSASEIMINVLIHHEVADYAAWKALFDSAFDWRHKNGERNCRIFRSAGNVNALTLFFEWESLEKAREFIASEELKTRMASAGVKGAPRVDFLTEVQSIRRSAAD